MHAIVGATGKTGRRICERLLSEGQHVRALGRDKVRLGALAKLGAECATVDILELDALCEAFTGASAVYLMSPTGPKVEAVYELHRQIGATLAQALRKSRVSHAVLMSACGVHREHDNPILGMRAIESELCTVPDLNLAMLRPGFFMDNLYAWFDEVRRDQQITNVIHPDRPLPMIATRDIAEVAARLMLERNFEGAVAFELLGPRDCSMREATAALGASIGNPALEYRQCEAERTEQMLRGFGYGSKRARYLVDIFSAFDRGLLAPERPRDKKSHTPTTIEDFATQEFSPGYRAFLQ